MRSESLLEGACMNYGLNKCFLISAIMVSAITIAPASGQPSVDVSPPQGTTVSIYDTGVAIINESRRVSLPAGESVLLIRDLPSSVDPASMMLGTVSRSAPFDVQAQELRYDLRGTGDVLSRLIGQPVVFQWAGQPREGVLLSGPMPNGDDGVTSLAVRSRDGKNLWLVEMAELSSMTFPFSREMVASVPEAVWTVRAREEGPQNFRLSYRSGGLQWNAYYDLMLDGKNQQGDLVSRVGLVNQSGGRFENARVRLLQTEKGLAVPAVAVEGGRAASRSPLIYGYQSNRPELEQLEAGIAPVHVYELPRTVTLEPDREHYVTIIQSIQMPLKQFYVYDGVRFDRFQRNPRTDWNYGTEYREDVQTHVEFENAEKFGLGVDLPAGLCRVFNLRADGPVDLIGESRLPHISKGGTAAIRIGPAIGLRGERERTGYVEVKPHHVYEESFEIRLYNSSDETAEVRVVEHIYRGSDYEIIRADSDYTKTDAQTLEFRAELKPAARRSIHYTVRYNW